MRTLVIYYSLEGNTKLMAETIASSLNADLYRVKPVFDIEVSPIKKYIDGTKLILDHCKPNLECLKVDFTRYDRIYVGTPVWALNVAPAIRTLLLDKIKDKEVALFYTYKGLPYHFEENARELIAKNNRLLSIHGFKNVQHHQMDCILESNYWAKRYHLSIK